MSKIEELKPCPLCDKPAKWLGNNLICCIDVVNCGCAVEMSPTMTVEKTREYTLRAWNKRTKED